ncbi:MAG: aquaporin [Candidatus Nanopelagicus sp.]|jgi:glycerol uptake facilitator-like aquaporin
MRNQRAYVMEFLGTMILAIAVVGSGHMAAFLAEDAGTKLLINALATAIGLAVVIRLGIKVSGSHFNPAVTMVMLYLKKIDVQSAFAYIFVQILGSVLGVGVANFIFEQSFFEISQIQRDGSHLLVSEILATSVLLWIILRFPKRDDLVALYVPLWIFGAILLTSSTSFANPAITIGRTLTNSFTGIAPASVILFIIAQFIGAVLGMVVAKNLTNPSKDSNE